MKPTGDPSPDPHASPPAARAGRGSGSPDASLQGEADPPRRSPHRRCAFGSRGFPTSEPPRHASWEGPGRIRLINREVRFQGEIDWDFQGEGPLWAYHLHQFDWARCPEPSPQDRLGCDARLGRAPPARDRMGRRTDQPANLLLDQASDDPGSAPRRSDRPRCDLRVSRFPAGDAGEESRGPPARQPLPLEPARSRRWRVSRSRGRRRTDGSPTSRLSAISSKSRCSPTERTTSEAPCTTRCCSRTCSIW